MAEIEKKAKAAAKPRTTAASAKKTEAMKATVDKPVTAKTPSHEDIAKLAHRYWAEHGGQNGHDKQDWLRAEQELKKAAS